MNETVKIYVFIRKNLKLLESETKFLIDASWDWESICLSLEYILEFFYIHIHLRNHLLTGFPLGNTQGSPHWGFTTTSGDFTHW